MKKPGPKVKGFDQALRDKASALTKRVRKQRKDFERLGNTRYRGDVPKRTRDQQSARHY